MVGLFFILIVEKTLNFINLKVTVTDTDTMVRTQLNLKLNKF